MKYQLEFIIWEDVYSSDGWLHVDDLDDWASDVWLVNHVGFVVKETKDFIVLSSSIMAHFGQGQERFAAKYKIPKKYIVKRVKIKEPKIKI